MNVDSLSASPGYRRIVLCADDFGMNPAIDAGILALAGQGRLSAASVLVDGPLAEQDMPALQATALQIGLHLNFTEPLGQSGLCLPLRTLISRAYLRTLPLQRVRAGIERQLRRFQDLAGRAPDYVDGHQHVHQLPGIREALVTVLAAHLGDHRPWVRDTSHPRTRGLPLRLQLKARVIAGLGAAALRRQLRHRGYSQNPGFLGVYDFQGGALAYERWMRCWLAQGRDGDLLMCHPALGADPTDELSAQRQSEFSVLSGAAMERLLVEHHLAISGQPPLEGASMSLSYRSLTRDFAVSPQLRPEDMQALAAAGFKSVIINRPDGEGGAEQPLSADVLAAAQAAGLQARYQPVVSGSITPADVTEFAHNLEELPAPTLAFCRSGGRCTKLFEGAQQLSPHSHL